MAEVINPAIVPKVTLPSGEQVPCGFSLMELEH